MSAIFGLINIDGRPVAPGDINSMHNALAAYGPDDKGIWTNGYVGVGQCLMRFTPEDSFEQQPLISPDRQRVLVHDGRLDNRPELSAELDIYPAEAKQLPDSAIILRSYEKWGEDCPAHLIGNYSFALWDAREKRLLIVRSPLGGRSLFYYRTPNLFAFATMPKGLFALPYIPRELNLERIADYLTTAPEEPGSSFFLNINKLSSGNLVAVRREGCTMRKFWQPDTQREIHYARDDDYVDAFNALFERVVSDHLRSTAPVGVMMSGGLDSTSVAATAAPLLKRAGKRLAAFTEVPRTGFDGAIIMGRYADETPFVQAMARQYDNLDLNLIRTDGHTYLEDLDRFFDAADMPFRNASNRVWYEAILREAQKQGVRILLTGGQGNLTISRTGSGLLPLLIRTGKWGRALREAYALHQRTGTGSALRTLAGQGVLPLLPTPLWTVIQRLRRKDSSSAGEPLWQAYSAINPAFALAQKVDMRARDKGVDFRFRLKPDMRRTIGKMLPSMTENTNNINHTYQSMFGVELLDPTADRRIVEFCLGLPEEQYLKDGISRRLIRRAMAVRLPAEVLTNKRRGLQAADWFERLCGAREQIRLELSGWKQSELLSGVLDLDRLQRLAEQMPQPDGDAGMVMRDYRMVLEFGLMMGRFIRWFETSRVAA